MVRAQLGAVTGFIPTISELAAVNDGVNAMRIERSARRTYGLGFGHGPSSEKSFVCGESAGTEHEGHVVSPAGHRAEEFAELEGDRAGTALEYFEGPIIVSSWYPERDYFTLIETLVGTVDPKAVGGDVWRFFGTTAAQRDIGGTENTLPKESRVRPGLYQSFKTEGPADIGLFVKRAISICKLHSVTTALIRSTGAADMPLREVTRLFVYVPSQKRSETHPSAERRP